MTGLAATPHWDEDNRRMADAICRDAPAAMGAAGADLILADQMEPAGGAVADRLSVPSVTVCSALDINGEAAIPPTSTPWSQPTPGGALAQPRRLPRLQTTVRPIQVVIDDHRRRWGLPRQHAAAGLFASSRFAQLCQQPAAFDFPAPGCRPASITPVRCAAPVARGCRPCAFPYAALTGQPLIYAPLGTLQNRRPEIFRCIAAACAGLDCQLVMTLGRGEGRAAARICPICPAGRWWSITRPRASCCRAPCPPSPTPASTPCSKA